MPITKEEFEHLQQAKRRRARGLTKEELGVLQQVKRESARGKLSPRQRYEEAMSAMASADPRLGPLAQFTDLLLPIGPMLDLAGPQAPLTERMFGGQENFGTRAADVALKLGPLAAGIAASRIPGGRQIAGRAGQGLVDVLSGITGGAAGGAAQAALQEQPITPSAVMGGVLGGGLGAGVWGLTRAGRRLAAAYAARPGAELFPDIDVLAAQLPFVGLEKSENVVRAQGAREAFRRLVPAEAAAEIKVTNPVLWQRAISEARGAAARSTKEGPLLNIEAGSGAGRRMSDNVFRIKNEALRHNSIDATRHYWRVYVTNLGTTLARDREFGPYGSQFADVIRRANQLGDHMEGSIHNNVLKPLWRGVKDDPELIDKVLSGEGGRLSSEGMAVVKRWREMADGGFQQLRKAGVMEEVSAGHPGAKGGQTDLFPEMPRIPTGEYEIIPIQRRTNYVPYYRDPAGVAKLMKKASPERQAYLKKIIENGDADTFEEAGKLLDERLKADSHWSKLHIRSGMQHERELAYGLPRDRNAKRWMERWAHDISRRLSTAKVAGGQDEQVVELLKNMREDGLGIGADRIERIWKNYIGRPPHDVARMLPIARKARSFIAIEMLSPRTGILQMLQLANPAARFGIRRTLEGITTAIRNPELRGAADEVGALLPARHLLVQEEPMEAVGRWWVDKMTWMPAGDRMARDLSAITAGVTAKAWAQEYWQLAQRVGEQVPRTGAGAALKYVGIRNRAERMTMLKNRLEQRLGIPVDHVMKAKGELPIESTLAAMRNGSHDTQFANSILDLPEMRRTGRGQLLYMLRTYQKQQSTLIMKIARDAARGDTGPALRLLVTYPVLYAGAKPFLDFFSNKDAVDEADTETLERAQEYLIGALSSGMWGGMGDFLIQMSASDPGRAAGWAAGPVASTALGFTFRDVPEAFRGNFDPLIQRVTPKLIRNLIQRAQEQME